MGGIYKRCIGGWKLCLQHWEDTCSIISCSYLGKSPIPKVCCWPGVDSSKCALVCCTTILESTPRCHQEWLCWWGEVAELTWINQKSSSFGLMVYWTSAREFGKRWRQGLSLLASSADVTMNQDDVLAEKGLAKCWREKSIVRWQIVSCKLPSGHLT